MNLASSPFQINSLSDKQRQSLFICKSHSSMLQRMAPFYFLCSFCLGFTWAPKQSAQQNILYLGRKHLGFQSPKQGFPACHGWLWWMKKTLHFLLTWYFAGTPSSIHLCKSSAFCPPIFVPCLSVAHLTLVSWFSVDLISKAPFLEFF